MYSMFTSNPAQETNRNYFAEKTISLAPKN